VPYDRPSVGDFKAYFVRDFPYGDEEAPSGGDGGSTSAPLDFVLTSDIQKALNRTALMINEALAPDQAFFTEIYLLLSAHNMVMSLRVSSQGVGSQPEWLRVGKSAGSVSESFQIPERFVQNPQLALLQRTGYGQEYLELILPNLIGQISWVPGRTLP
jgi:hypothetical protein